MTRTAALFGLLSALSRASWTLAIPSAVFAKPLVSPFSDEVRALLELPEDKIDLGHTALIFAREIYPAIDIEAYSQDRRVGGGRSALRSAACAQERPPAADIGWTRDPDANTRGKK